MNQLYTDDGFGRRPHFCSYSETMLKLSVVFGIFFLAIYVKVNTIVKSIIVIEIVILDKARLFTWNEPFFLMNTRTGWDVLFLWIIV